jgi:hypothetical protein
VPRPNARTDELHPIDPEYAAQLSAGIVKAIGEATTLLDAGDPGGAAHGPIRHARDLHIQLEDMIAGDPETVPSLREVCDVLLRYMAGGHRKRWR